MINRDRIDILVENILEVVEPSENGAADSDELICSYIADQIVQMLIIDRFYMHAIKDVKYNRDNKSLLIVIHANFNEHIIDIVRMLNDINAVKVAKEFERTSEEGFKYFVIKVIPNLDLTKDKGDMGAYAPEVQATSVGNYGDITQFGTY